MRGTLIVGLALRLHVGIIPACAGNTRFIGLGAVDIRDHPRVCGEHIVGDGTYKPFEGSSPRVRGTRCAASFLELQAGIIPACAGNT